MTMLLFYRVLLHQTGLVKTFEQYVPANGKEVKTPAPPGQILHKPNDDSTILTDDELTQYCSGTGKRTNCAGHKTHGKWLENIQLKELKGAPQNSKE